jgi:hypothetical protein
MAPFSRRLAAAALAALLPTCLAVTVSYHHPSFKDMKIHEEHTMHDTDWTACAQATSSILNPLAVFDVIKFHVTNPERPITVYVASTLLLLLQLQLLLRPRATAAPAPAPAPVPVPAP